MNDDRKFQERAETMRQLFLARIPADVVAKVAGISKCTVQNDRVRIAEHYAIEVPNPVKNSLEREKLFRLLLKNYLTVKFETGEWKNPIYQAAKLLINFERIEYHINSLERFYEGLQLPQFPSDDSIAKNYQQLIEDCLEVEHRSTLEFYEAIYSGSIPYEDFRSEDDLIDLATKFYLSKNRSSINTLVIDDPKNLVDSLFSELTEIHVTALKEKYGLDGQKKTTSESAKEHGLAKERIRQIRQKALYIFQNELIKKKHLIHSTAKCERLEKQYAELDEKYKSYCKATDQEILKLNAEIYRLKGLPNKIDESFDSSKYSDNVVFLIKPIREIELELPVRAVNGLRYADCCYVLDIVEKWESLADVWNFGTKSYIAIDDCFLAHGVNRSKITVEEKILARQLIKRAD